jgi:hypothetical protein
MRVWNGDQPSRSRRAGTVERIGTCAVADIFIYCFHPSDTPHPQLVDLPIVAPTRHAGIHHKG